MLVVLMFLVIVPGLLTLLDVSLGTSIYLIRPTQESYTGGYIEFGDAVSDLVGQAVIYLDLIILNTLLIVPLAYFSFFDRKLERQTRNLARGLLVVQILVLLSSFFFESAPRGVINLLIGSLYIIAYSVAAFRQLVSFAPRAGRKAAD